MKNAKVKIISVLLVLSMLIMMLVMPVSATLIKKGTNGRTIYLSVKATATKNGAEITTVSKGAVFFVEIHFANNPTEPENSVQSYDLFLGYDGSKMTPTQKLNGLTAPTTNYSGYADNIIKLSWANEEGIVNEQGDIASSGILAYIRFTANEALTKADIDAISFPATGLGNSTAKMGKFSIAQAPALVVSITPGTYSDTATEASLKSAMSVKYINHLGEEYVLTDYSVALPDGGLREGSNTLSVYANGLTETVSINVQPQVACPSRQFSDVPAKGNWAHEGIDYCIANQLMKGISDTMFSPNGTVTRGQLVTILYRMEGSPKVGEHGTFADVRAGKYYSDAVEWAAANGIVNGITTDTFAPDSAITREQIAAILYRYSNSPKVTGDLQAYPDGESAGKYAKTALVWATQEGLLNGVKSDGVSMLQPKAPASRAQIAAIMMRLCKGSFRCN